MRFSVTFDAASYEVEASDSVEAMRLGRILHGNVDVKHQSCVEVSEGDGPSPGEPSLALGTEEATPAAPAPEAQATDPSVSETAATPAEVVTPDPAPAPAATPVPAPAPEAPAVVAPVVPPPSIN